MKKLHILSFRADAKQQLWQQASRGQLSFRKVSRPYAILVILLCPLLGPIDVVLFRYLNDRRKVISSFFRFLSELIIVLVARSRGMRIYWLAHNVNRESKIFNPRLSQWRRKTLGYFSTDIFVTEDGLIEPARNMLPHAKFKPIHTCTFGLIEDETKKPKRSKALEVDLKCVPKGKSHYLVSINNWSPKKARETSFLLDISRRAENFPSVHFIVGGNQVSYIRKQNSELYNALASRNNVSLLEGWVAIEQLVRQKICSALIKSYDDLSLSLGLVSACSLRLPIISEKEVFMGELVERYDIGIAVDADTSFECIIDACNRLRECSEHYERFLKNNTWERGAMALLGCPQYTR